MSAGRTSSAGAELDAAPGQPSREDGEAASPFAVAAEPSAVLIVDDEETVRQFFLDLFEPDEFRVAAYPSAEAALAASAAGRFDLAVIDKNLPGLSGIELMRDLKARDPLLEVIIITGYASLQTAIEALQLGAYDYIEKPFPTIGIIQEKVRKAIDRRALALANQRLLAHLQEVNRELTERNVQLLDIQEQLLAQLRLASVGQLAVSVGMELTNPLATIKSNVQLLEEQLEPALRLVREVAEAAVVSPELGSLRRLFVNAAQSGGLRNADVYVEDALQAFREIKEEIERLARMVKGMQLFAYAERGEPRAIDVAPCIARAVELVERDRLRRGVELRVDVASDLPPLRGSAHLLTQSFLNLLQNAVEAIPHDGLVEIRARREDGRLRILISDTGVGIRREDLSKVLRPFYTTKEAEGHVGMGLNLAEEIIRRHGGTLRIESTLGTGTRVIVNLPAATSEKEA
jgi:signal transduction histidine kinase